MNSKSSAISQDESDNESLADRESDNVWYGDGVSIFKSYIEEYYLSDFTAQEEWDLKKKHYRHIYPFFNTGTVWEQLMYVYTYLQMPA